MCIRLAKYLLLESTLNQNVTLGFGMVGLTEETTLREKLIKVSKNDKRSRFSRLNTSTMA